MKIKKTMIKSTLASALLLSSIWLLLAVHASAQTVIGSWQNNTGDGWIDNGNSLSITNAANTNKYQFVTGVVAGYARSLEINQAAYNQNLEIDLAALPGGRAAFLANRTISFTVSFPAASVSGATAGYSQIYSFNFNSAAGYTSVPWSSFTGNSGNMPGVGYYTGFAGQSITVIWDYSQLLTNPIVTNSSYLQISFTSNNGGGAPTNFFMNNVVLAGGASPVQTFTVDDFVPGGVGPQNPANYDYYSSSNNYASGQISNVWWNWFGGAFTNVVWDASTDAGNDPSSGSMMVNLNWDGGSQFVLWNQGEVNNYYALNLDAQQFTNFQCDVKFAPGSASSAGTFGQAMFGHLRFGDRTSSYGQDWFGAVDIVATNTSWVHVSVPLNAISDPNLTNINGLLIGIDTGYYSLSLSGASTFWVDNIKFTGPVAVVSNPPPILSIQKAVPSLRIFAGSTANTYDREELATVDQQQSWIGGSGSVTYAFKLLSAPSLVNWQTHMFLIPVNSAGANIYNNQFLDYNASNSVWLQINGNANGTCTANLAWKTNLPNANPNNVAVNITNSTPVGTWTVTFTSPNGGTLTAPGASPVSFTISDANVSSDFANPLVAIFGIQPQSAAYYGSYADYASIKISGVAGSQTSDDFTTATTLGANWDTSDSAYPASIQLVTTNTPYWVNWTLPANGYGLGTAMDILGNTNTSGYPWVLPEYYNNYNDGLTVPGAANQGFKTWLLLPGSTLPTSDGSQGVGGPLAPNAYFKLFNPPLQN